MQCFYVDTTQMNAFLTIVAVTAIALLIWLYLLGKKLDAIHLFLMLIGKETNKDAGAIKRRQTWSKKRELKDLKQGGKN